LPKDRNVCKDWNLWKDQKLRPGQLVWGSPCCGPGRIGTGSALNISRPAGMGSAGRFAAGHARRPSRPPRGPPLHCLLSTEQGFQTFTQACGLLAMAQPRDAFLAALCEFALSDATEPSAGAPGGGGASSDRLADRDGGDGALVLSPKNVQSMRTVFNIAHRLGDSLGPAWALVLGTLSTLDRVLDSPRTTTRVRHRRAAHGSPHHPLRHQLLRPVPARGSWQLRLQPARLAGLRASMGGSGLRPAERTRRHSLPLCASAQEAASGAAGGGISSPSGGVPSDLAILAAAANQLFESTRGMSREAAVSLLSALRDVSLRGVPRGAAATVQAPPK
jgi:hypothetical protein